MRKILSALLISLLLFSTLTSCSLLEKGEEESREDNQDENQDKNESSGENIEEDIGVRYPTVFSLYPPGGRDDIMFSAILKLSYEETLDEIFYPSNKSRKKALLAKFTVVEDYYGYLKEGDTVYVPYIISYPTGEGGFFDEENARAATISFLEEAEYFFCSVRFGVSDFELSSLYVEDEDAINNRKRYTIDAEEGVYCYRLFDQYLDKYYTVPLNDGRLDLDAVDRVVYEITGWEHNHGPDFRCGRHHLYYDNYFYQGMPESEIPETLDRLNEDRKLYNRFTTYSKKTEA